MSDRNYNMQENMEETLSIIKGLINDKGLSFKVSRYLNLIKSFRFLMLTKETNVLYACEVARTSLHSEILKDLGCQASHSRDFCDNCPHFCVKFAFLMLVESKADEIACHAVGEDL